MLTLNSILDGLNEDKMDLIIGSDIKAGWGTTKQNQKTEKTEKTKKTTKTTRKFCDP